MSSLLQNLRIPAFQAPMFLQSGPEMVIASCRAGVLGSFPSLNARTVEELEEWLQQITASIRLEEDAPWAINLVMHHSNSRREQDLALAIEYNAPLVISSLGSPRDAIDAVHSYGGLVYADVTTTRFAKKAIDSGADGLVLVAAGAGGHTGELSGFAFVEEVRSFWDGPIVLAGGISSGRAIRAAEVLGANYAYLGTRFITTIESMAVDEYKQMVVDSSGEDIVCSAALTGVKANWLRDSLLKAGYDPDDMSAPPGRVNIEYSVSDAKRWRDVWAAGHGVGAINEILSISELVKRLEREYRLACEGIDTLASARP